MNTLHACGIVAEYNPLHNGHLYQMRLAREKTNCDLLVVVLSGNFTQRGEPAIFNKWIRAKEAVKNGVDLVIELPYVYATQSATGFAKGAIQALSLAHVDWLCFGSECGNLDNLQEIAQTPINPDHLHQSMDQGMSFPKTYSLLSSEMRPNDILAASYLKQLQGTNIKPIVVQRTTNYLDSALHSTASALAIRQAIKNGQDLLDTTPMKDICLSRECAWPQLFYPYFRTFILTSTPETLSKLFLFSEGIENLFIKNAKQEDTYEGFLNACTNYRYTSGRIRRCMLQAMNQVTKEEVQHLPELDRFRVLCFNDIGREYLKQLSANEVLYSSRFAQVPQPYRDMEYRSSLLYTSVLSNTLRREILQNEIGGALYIKNDDR